MVTTDAALPLSPAGSYEMTIETGVRETTIRQTFRSHLVDEANVIVRSRDGIAWRLERVDLGETDGRLVLVFIRQRKTGGDYARRVSIWSTDASIDEHGTNSERALLARVRAALAPAPTAVETVRDDVLSRGPVAQPAERVHGADFPLQAPSALARQLVDIHMRHGEGHGEAESVAFVHKYMSADVEAAADARLWAVEGYDAPMTGAAYRVLVVAALDEIAVGSPS